MSQQRPHVSAAIQSLRPVVTTAAIAVVLCATIQLLVFGFVHFTEVRWDKTERPVTAQTLSVVASPAQPAAQKPTIVQGGQPAAGAQPAVQQVAQPAGQVATDTTAGRRGRKVTDVEAAALQRVESSWAPVLQQFSTIAVVIGIVCAVALALFTHLGVVVAGGGAVPGVERAVKAMAWATLLALFALPLQDIMPSAPFAGVFGSYAAMTAASDAVDAGKAALAPMLATHLLLPGAAIVLGGLVVVNFRAGVERGVIVTSVSELDQALEREMEQIKSRGIGSNVGARTIGTLNRAIGDAPVAAPAAAPPAPIPAPAPIARPAPAPADSDPSKGRSWVSPSDRRMNQPSSGNPLRRLV